MESFFDDIEEDFEELEKQQELRKFGCDTCKLYKSEKIDKYIKTEPIGKGKKRILIVGEYPLLSDSESFKSLKATLRDNNVSMAKDCFYVNAVRCRPNKKGVTKLHINSCKKYLHEFIENNDINVIIALGTNAMEALVGHKLSGRISKVSIKDWIGEVIPDQELKCWIIPTYSLVELAQFNRDIVLQNQFRQHVKKACSQYDVEILKFEYNNRIKIILESEKVIDLLKNNKWKVVAFDYETTGRKPQRLEQKIISVSISDGEISYAFPYFDDLEFKKAYSEFLENPKIRKIAHNLQFEHSWGIEKAGACTKGWYWDTMLGEHVRNSHKKTNLKLHIYLKFGIIGYDDYTDKYLTKVRDNEDIKSGNALNRINEADLHELLQYNALDSLFTYWLFRHQKRYFPRKEREALLFFTEASIDLAEISNSGMFIDIKKMNSLYDRLSDKIEKMKIRLMDLPDIKKWDKQEPINIDSGDQLGHLLFDILKIKCPKRTPGGGYSTSADTLQSINHPIPQKILQIRKLSKVAGTYLSQYERELNGNYIHPNFLLNRVKTFRSSSAGPNFQNIPKRDKKVQAMLRGFMKPRPGGKIIEYDYKAVEVSLAACYNKDPNLIKYVTDDSTDMHKDSAAELFMKKPSEIDKTTERSLAKNAFVFPEFYGSYYEQVAPDLWKRMAENTRKHLYNKGVRTFEDFQEHVKNVEYRFWNKRFPVYNEWKKKTLKVYEKKGYIELYTGFRVFGPLRRNQILNVPIQGTAFHCLLWTLMNVNREIKKCSYDSLFIGQIHDAMLGDVKEYEEKEVDRLVWDYGTQKIREHWDWLIVPLKLEKEATDLNGSWAKMNEYGYLDF